MRTLNWLQSRRAERLDTHHGQALILFALLLPVLVGISGLTLDAGALYYQRRHLQSIADAAALTGAQRANFNSGAPAILNEGRNHALSNAYLNGAQLTETTVHLPPVAAPWTNKADYIEVIVSREVPHHFMGLFGMRTTTIQARAVARCVKPGFGDPAILALDPNDGSAIRFDGGGTGLTVEGDIISFGGINPNGNASHFAITGAAFALNGPAANVSATNGSFGTNSGMQLFSMGDPIVQGLNATPPSIVWPTWPTNQWATATFHETPTNSHDSDGDVTTKNGDTVTLAAGRYKNLNLSNGTVTFSPGVYVIDEKISFGSQVNVTGDGVLIRLNGTGEVFSVQGGASYNFTAVASNTWKDIVIYTPSGDLDLQGNGDRQIHGSVYAPLGEVEVAGNATGTTVFGQVIGWHVRFSGNGGAVRYTDTSNNVIFGPILVNTP